MNTTLRAILFGKIIANRIIKANPGKTLIFTMENIGDQCMELAYAKQFKENNGIKHLAVITSNPNHALFSYFHNSYDSLITVTKKDIDILLKFFKSDIGQLYRRSHPQIICAFYTAYVRSDLLLNNPYIRLSDIEKQIFHLAPDTVPADIVGISHPDWIKELLNNKQIIKGKTVLLNPYANSCSGVPMSLFESLAAEFKNRGFCVITGIHAGQTPVKGTEGLDFPLENTIELVEECGYVVGLRSGFMDLCAFSHARILVLDSDSYELADATRLEDWWPQNRRIRTFRYENVKNNIQMIAEYIFEEVDENA